MAARFWIGGGTNANWNASPTTNWAATSGGVTRVAAPTSADDVTFDGAGAAGNSNSTISATITCLSFTVTGGYTQTITHNAVLTVAGNVTLNTSYTIAGASGMTISAASTINSGGKTWPNSMTFGTGTKVITSNLSITGNLTTQQTQTITLNGGSITVGGTYIISQNTTVNKTASETISANGLNLQNSPHVGTAKIILTGGTWSTTSAASTVTNDLDIKGNVTVSGTVYYFTGTLKYDSTGGPYTVTTTGSTLTLVNSCTFDTNGITWATVRNTQNNPTFTINSLLSATTYSTNNSNTFAGTVGFTVETLLSDAVVPVTITLKEAITYTVTTSLSGFTTRVGAILTFASSSGTVKANLTLSNGASCNCLADFTRIDASGGRPIRTFLGTITNCVNIQQCNDLATVASAA